MRLNSQQERGAKQPAVFLDRDGTLIEPRHYLKELSELALMPGVGQALKRLHDAGFLLILVTNQSGVARGFFDEEFVRTCHDKLQYDLRQSGVQLDGLYFCPHHPDAGADPYKRNCDCRKPGIGMPLQAKRDFDIDIGASWMIGDSPSDIQMGHALKIPSILLRTGYGRNTLEDAEFMSCTPPAWIAEDMTEAASIILEEKQKRSKP
jgi:D-glycero-D-manno-heptose 1,7-bisphosphate phosphatase